ncbi:MAG TPA: histidine phosphatase family protein [Pyrinomonadaceae bacterium]|jgi:probable phosphoglycerate mutase|nr:histidine phosphatase family protein [Pyrinomonadaceae bacterium]
MPHSTTHVLLIRHGQSEGNAARRFGGHTATPLSPRGRRQAQATARALQSEELSVIYSSDLARAVETAQPLANLTGLPVNATTAFRERSVGVMEGLTFEAAAQQHPEQYAALLQRDFEHVLTGGESYRQLLDRAVEKLDEIIAENKGGKIAVFSHTGTICILALHLMGALDAPTLKPVWISSANCGVTRVELRDDGFVRVLNVNDTRHLSGT